MSQNRIVIQSLRMSREGLSASEGRCSNPTSSSILGRSHSRYKQSLPHPKWSRGVECGPGTSDRIHRSSWFWAGTSHVRGAEHPAQQRRRSRNGAPGEIRTPDLMLRRHSLYPAELRARSNRIPHFSLSLGAASRHFQVVKPSRSLFSRPTPLNPCTHQLLSDCFSGRYATFRRPRSPATNLCPLCRELRPSRAQCLYDRREDQQRSSIPPAAPANTASPAAVSDISPFQSVRVLPGPYPSKLHPHPPIYPREV